MDLDIPVLLSRLGYSANQWNLKDELGNSYLLEIARVEKGIKEVGNSSGWLLLTHVHKNLMPQLFCTLRPLNEKYNLTAFWHHLDPHCY
jgi:hypothetical protein